MEQTNEPGPADGQRKIEAEVHTDVEQTYKEFLRKEQDALDNRLKGEATQDFDKVRNLGFATKKDIETQMEGVFGKFFKEMETMREENKKLREWVMRAKAQGLNSGVTDNNPVEDNPMKKWRPTW